MLVQLMLKNILSFRDETVLDLSAINAYHEHECNVINTDSKDRLLKVTAIYGANASGKSNLHFAMSSFQRIIAESLNNVDDGAATALEKYYIPFSFEDSQENSEYQIVIIVDDYEYRYGFEYNDKCIVTEWLYRKNLKSNRTVTIFERTTDFVDFGASVRKECDAYKEQVPVETLVLSFFNKLKLKTSVFKKVYSGIMDTLVVQSDFCEDTHLLETLLPQVINVDKNKLIEFLTAIDTGIKDISYVEKDKDINFITTHFGKDGKRYSLDLYLESEGTIKSIMLFIYARMAILNNKSLFIDELNIKLHPLLMKYIIDLFYNEKSSAQLIYTTHDTTLMDKKFFRRDQIWFVQKDEDGYSELTALSNFKVRSDSSFEKDYLAGVYGGIPLLKEFNM